MARMVHVVAEPVDGDRVALVGGRGDAGAVERLQPLGVGEAEMLSPRAMSMRHVIAADGDGVDMDEPAAGENTPTDVEPPPKSTSAAPSSASSSTSVDRPAA